METSTKVDKVVYNRVPHIRESIDNKLISTLVESGSSIENIKIKCEDIPGGCCKQMKVTAYDS